MKPQLFEALDKQCGGRVWEAQRFATLDIN